MPRHLNTDQISAKFGVQEFCLKLFSDKCYFYSCRSNLISITSESETLGFSETLTFISDTMWCRHQTAALLKFARFVFRVWNAVLYFKEEQRGTSVTINRVLVRTWEATGRSILLRNFGGEASSEADTRMTTKKVERLNEDGPYGKLCELEVDATQWRSSARAFARGSGLFGLWYERIWLG